MNFINKLTISKPVSVWNKSISLEPRNFLFGIGKAVLKGASLDWSGVAEVALDTVDAAGLREKPGDLAWLLIYRALTAALAELVKNNRDLFRNRPEEAELETLSARFEEEMGRAEVTISPEFFNRPNELPLLKDLQGPLRDWLQGLGAQQTDAEQIACRLPDYFVFALHETWRKAPQDYAELRNHFDSPFTSATEEVRSWQLYKQWLQRQISDRMFEEAFGVEKVYVPLRAYYEEKERDEESNPELAPQQAKVKRIVVDLEDEFRNWLHNFADGPAVRFISGGPGSGKSTFAKIFAAKIAAETDIPCLYIPLHLFDATDNLIAAMESHIRNNPFLSGNPLDAKAGKDRLLIIFDGLDELALQGKAASEIANSFVEEVLNRIRECNGYHKHRRVIITGRTIAIQSVAAKLREAKQISHVLPYFIAEKEREKYHDPDKRLAEDQRQRWWRQYGAAAGKDYAGLPADLAREHLAEITAQPLLNYLVALSYDRKTIKFTDETTLNQIYADLIKAVYCRQYEDRGRRSPCAGGLEEPDFLRVLEEIALAVWHGDGRTATVVGIREKFKAGDIERYLEPFKKEAEAGVIRLLTAFYFRQSENRQDGDPTFEFTHKSFGEYLTALRIVRLLRQIEKQRRRQQEDPDDGWSEKEALQHWTSFCAVMGMHEGLLRFISNEFAAMTQEERLALQGMVRDLLSYTINQGLPFPAAFLGKGFKEHLRLARNAEEALLAIHFYIAKQSKQVSRLKLESDTTFGEWVSRLRGQQWNDKQSLLLLGYIDLSFYQLNLVDLFKVNLEGASLERADFFGANLERANLFRANLEGADFFKANLVEANLVEANLTRANFFRTKIFGANLFKANLFGARFERANFFRTCLERANLEEANLEEANLKEANLKEANLKNAGLREVNLRSANLEGANLKGADLTGAILTGTILEKKEDGNRT